MKLDSSLSRKRITDGDLIGLADPAHRRVGHDALHRLVGEDVGHLGLDQAGGDAIDADIVRGERLGAAARQRDHARLGRRVMDLHLARPQRGHRRDQDDPPEASRDHLVLDREDDQERPVQIHVDRLEPELVDQAGMVADVADRAAVGEQVDRPKLLSCLRDKASHVVRLGDVASERRSPCGPGPGSRRRPARPPCDREA